MLAALVLLITSACQFSILSCQDSISTVKSQFGCQFWLSIVGSRARGVGRQQPSLSRRHRTPHLPRKYQEALIKSQNCELAIARSSTERFRYWSFENRVLQGVHSVTGDCECEKEAQG